MMNLALLVRSTLASDAATFGKFFYVDFVRNQKFAAHYLDVAVGSDDAHMHMWATTDEHNSGVMTTECANCKTTPKWNLDESQTKDTLFDGQLY